MTVPVCPDISLLEIHMAVLDSNRGHCTIAIEVDVVFEYWGITMIRLNSEESSVYLWRYDTVNLEVNNVTFQPRWSVEALENFRLWELELVGVQFAIRIVRHRDLWCQVMDMSHGEAGEL